MVKNKIPVMFAVAAVMLVAYSLMKTPDGGEIFAREGCTKCHILRGQGIGVIDLTNVRERRSREWISEQIVNPRLHSPYPGMPSFAHLKRSEVEALIDYIEDE